ncbi:3-methyl-2-oxobutanoate hydroxymethyltransferase [Roseisalinus antarcticus]|uniref:3-methyl-2-oxobutanoate hydroxymethyltransferase n=1 Tax=Roseisalinus antarcticus TaxID=254357 RepID=A0A1Y5TFA4_9RHOB|nr:3-methyl-2-oxobutanoate hydroxymethyltransferase [Roseisalinus antarcticus]SLN62488.1 3-methyl-2-oxobutanoate hydroxymethyltransferase [Roseisalinus antarcticus]
MPAKRLTVADMRALKGERQLTMLRVTTMEEAEAADAAGIDIVSVPPELLCRPDYRDAAPTLFSMPGENYYDIGTSDDFVRWAFRMLQHDADAVYCSASLKTIKAMADEAVPVIGHVGLIPSRRTWTGGFKAVGKTADSAFKIWEAVQALEAAGAIGAEIEVVPVEVAQAISERTPLIMLSMGAGAGCDAQYLFAEDILGAHRGHMPRHSKVYRDFAGEFERLQQERIAAFSEYRTDVETGAFPTDSYVLRMDPDEMTKFRSKLG